MTVLIKLRAKGVIPDSIASECIQGINGTNRTHDAAE